MKPGVVRFEDTSIPDLPLRSAHGPVQCKEIVEHVKRHVPLNDIQDTIIGFGHDSTGTVTVRRVTTSFRIWTGDLS